MMPFKTIDSICQFTRKIVGTQGVQKMDVALEGGVKGLSGEQTVKVSDLVTIKITSSMRKGVRQDKHPCESWFVLTNTQSQIALISQFRQINEIHKHEF